MGPHYLPCMGGLWSQPHKKVVYFDNKCGPVLVGPHFPRYVKRKMWSDVIKTASPILNPKVIAI